MITVVLSGFARAADWVAQNSLGAALVVVLILALQRLGRGFMSARMLSNLWLILLLHLVLPWKPASPVSVHAWFGWLQRAHPVSAAAPLPVVEPARAEANPAFALVPAPAVAGRAITPREEIASWCRFHPLVVTWAAGACVFGVVAVVSTLRDWRRLGRTRPVDHVGMLRVFELCRVEAGVDRAVRLEESDEVPGPMVTGLWRARVLIPTGVAARLTEDELRHVFLHEMAHIRRRDVPVACAMSALLVLHWFNPLLWLASLRLRADRELACDAFVLNRSRDVTARAYGRTMIHLLEQCQRPAAFASAAGILESRTEVKRRIAMIAQHQNTPRWRELASLAAGAALACAVLSRPVEGQNAPPASTVPTVTTTVAANGNYEDSVDLPFVEDPRAIGTWESVDFVATPDEFRPGARQFQGDLYLKELVFNRDGTMNWPTLWTNGYVLNRTGKTASRYEIFVRESQTYMALEWKSGDYVIRHQKPKFYILHQVSLVPKPQPPRTVDNVDLPFVDDPAVIGRWVSVDFVRVPEQFVPGKKRWQGGDLFLKQLQFLPNGAMDNPRVSWTNGAVLNARERTASHYEIRQLGGKWYLFYEWKSGDYTVRGMKPQYYVLQKES